MIQILPPEEIRQSIQTRTRVATWQHGKRYEVIQRPLRSPGVSETAFWSKWPTRPCRVSGSQSQKEESSVFREGKGTCQTWVWGRPGKHTGWGRMRDRWGQWRGSEWTRLSREKWQQGWTEELGLTEQAQWMQALSRREVEVLHKRVQSSVILECLLYTRFYVKCLHLLIFTLTQSGKIFFLSYILRLRCLNRFM